MLDNLGLLGQLFVALGTAIPVMVASNAFVDPIKALVLAVVGYGLLILFVMNVGGFGID